MRPQVHTWTKAAGSKEEASDSITALASVRICGEVLDKFAAPPPKKEKNTVDTSGHVYADCKGVGWQVYVCMYKYAA